MDLMEWNPFRDINRQMIDFFERSPFRFLADVTTPRVDVYQTDTDVIVKAEIPGVSKDDLNVIIDENAVRLSGQVRRSEEFKAENIYRSERHYGAFSRVIPLPAEVKAEQARAEYRDGVLTIRAPKAEPSRMRGRRLDIH